MHTTAVFNYKGGVGKTTVTANLAAGLAMRGKRVLVIDTDPQASLSFSFIKPEVWERDYATERTIKTWFDAIVEGTPLPALSQFIVSPEKIHLELARRDYKGSVDLICSHLGLINLDLQLAVLLGGVNMQQTKQNYLRVHGNLRHALVQLASEGEYDQVLIDCAPNFNIVSKNAILASDAILIPARADYLSLLGFDYMRRSVRELVKDYNEYAALDTPRPKPLQPRELGVVFTMVQQFAEQPIQAQQTYMAQFAAAGAQAFGHYFRENNTLFSGAPESLLPLVLSDPRNGPGPAIIDGIRKLVAEIEHRISVA